MKNWHLLVILLVLMIPFAESKSEDILDFTGRVMRVQDGDAFYITHSGKVKPVRLNGVDCPELGQPYGSRARKVLSDLVLGKNIHVRVYETDDHGRMIADVFVSEDHTVTKDLIRSGHCRPIPSHAPDAEESETKPKNEVTDD